MEPTGTEVLNFQKGSKALYIQIKELYKEQILSGQIKHGERIDSEAQIQKLFGVCRITARQAILDLEREGLVNRGRGRGTFVTWKSPEDHDSGHSSGLWKISAEEDHHTVVFRQIVREQVSEEIADDFHVPPEQPMYCQIQIFGTESVPVSFSKTWYAGTDRIQEKDSPLSRTEIHEHLLSYISDHEKTFDETITAVVPDQEVRVALRISDEIPVLCRIRKVYGENRNLLQIESVFSRGDLGAWHQRGIRHRPDL